MNILDNLNISNPFNLENNLSSSPKKTNKSRFRKKCDFKFKISDFRAIFYLFETFWRSNSLNPKTSILSPSNL